MKLKMMAAAALLGGLLTTQTTSTFAGEATMNETNIKTLANAFETSINKNDMVMAEAMFTPDFVDHSPFRGQTPDFAGFKAGFAGMRLSFPDLNVKVERTVAQGDMLTWQIKLSGTQLGSFMGAPASNKTFSIAAIDILRVKDGKIAEHWGVFDAAGMMGQLGMH